uniref:Uncharacterized protein n=1 Tax=Corvus moneduloides TaxID=1196302 RepID=A0A8U7M1Z4_CORMO
NSVTCLLYPVEAVSPLYMSVITLMFGSHRQYVLMVPAVLQNDSPGQVCLQFLNLNETISVRVILEYSSVSTTIFKKTVTANSGLQCFNFKIPPVHSAPLAFISFSAKGTTISLEERRSVMIWNTDSIVFVQTDKPIYRPGQTVRFRVVALDFNFKPVQEKPVSLYSFFLQDPRGNRIFQWQNVKSEMNIIQLEFPLTEEPILGNYKIIVAKKSGDKTSHSFLVVEYVLPKFDVTVTVPESLTVLDSEFTVKVCGLKNFPRTGEKARAWRRNQNMQGPRRGWSGLMWSLELSFICVLISFYCMSFQFHMLDKSFERFPGKVQCLVDKDNSPISNEVIQLFVNNKNTDNFTTDHKGVAEFSIDTSEMFDPEISLKAIYKTSDHCHYEGWIEPYYPEASLSVQRFYSWTSSFVRIGPLWKDLKCGQKRMITVHYVLNTEGYRSINAMNFYYVVSRRLWVGQNGTLTIPLVVSEEMAPALRLLVYTLHPDKELVADSVQLPVEKCFKNKVHLEFSEKQMNPASNVSLVIEAAANSFCAVRAMDQSVLLLKPETELTTEMVSCQMPCLLPRLLPPPLHMVMANTKMCFLQDMGIKFFTNSKVRQPVVCTSETVRRQPYVLNEGHMASAHYVKSSGNTGDRKEILPFSLKEVVFISTGKASISYTIPDTITKWKASAFCVEELAGFGTSVPATLTALQPFFVDLTLPYSIIRGEDFLLRATVFNYLDQCIKVCNVVFSVTAETKDDEACGGKAPGNISIDYRDTQIRTLLVEVLLTALPVCPILLFLQKLKHSRSTKSDIMGTAMQNLHQLLQMPFGCGEQNMVLFAPNIYVLDYLNKTGQLSEEVKSKATGYLVSGYQKQLSYKHPDGSYSIFGTRDKEGNTWLTAFVYRSFAQAGHLIYIDDSVQSQTLMWLASKQKTEGCFQKYALLLLAICFFVFKYPVIRNAFFCLETASEKRISDVYTQALMAYAFCLAGKAEKCESFLAELQKSAKEVGEFQSPSDKSPSFLDHAPSAEVEITSYVLLALLYKPNRNKDDLTKASGIVQWLIRQQNPYGGFSSTQDTVIALQALAAYGEATYNSASQNRVKITSKKPFENVFIVNNENRLLLQQTPLPEVPGKYSLTMNGSGCVFVQTALRYNIHLPEGYFGFLLSVQTPNASCPRDRPAKFDIVLISSYTGKRSSSNMLIIDVKMLSGFVPVKSSLDKLIDSHAVMQVENKKNHVLFYLQNVRWKQHVIGITIIWIYPIRCIYHVLFLISFLL